MESSSPTKKRKREAQEGFTVSVASTSKRELGPVLASFPSIQPTKSTPFRCYRQARTDRNGNELEADLQLDHTKLVGETETLDFESVNEDFSEVERGYSCEYMIGVYNKTSKVLHLQRAPTYVMSRQVKRLKGMSSATTNSSIRTQARAALGEAFGTKKAQAAIRAAERNKVDIAAMEDVADHLQVGIEASTASLPSKEQAKATHDGNRPIPPVNLEATTPAEVYNIHDIASEGELNSFPISSFIEASASERYSLLPFSRSNWVKRQLRELFNAPKLSKTNLKILLYIASMRAFKSEAFRVTNRATLQEKLKLVPEVVVDALISKFTETSRGDSAPKLTPTTETRLMTHMLALMLRLDDYSCEVAEFVTELSMSQQQVTSLFRSLGCTVAPLPKSERERLGQSMEEARAHKRAILKLPLNFPVPKSGSRAKR